MSGYQHQCAIHGWCQVPCCSPVQPRCPPIYPSCSCRTSKDVPITSNIMNFSSDQITKNSTGITYYSIGANSSVSSASPPSVVSNVSPIPFIFPSEVKILRLSSQYTVLNSAVLTLTGTLTFSVDLYLASQPSQGSQMIYANIYSSQINTLSGTVPIGATYSKDLEVCLNIPKNSTLAVVISVNNVATVADPITFIGSVGITYI